MSRASARDRARPEPPRQLRRSARRFLAPAFQRRTSAPGWCRGWSATPSARCSAWRCSRCCPKRSRRCRQHAVFGTLLAGILDLLRAREAGAAAPLPHRRVPRARRHGAAGARRRRVPQFHRRRDHLHRGADVGAARHQHGDRRRGARDSAGGRRRRHPARGRLQPQPRAAAERRLRARRASLGALRRVRRGRSRARTSGRTSSRSRRRACSTSRCRI